LPTLITKNEKRWQIIWFTEFFYLIFFFFFLGNDFLSFLTNELLHFNFDAIREPENVQIPFIKFKDIPKF